MDVPPSAVLSSLMSLCGFIISPSVVQVDGTDWKEPVLIWECVCMSTGAGKFPLCTYIETILNKVQDQVSDQQRSWEVGDSTFEKMGERIHLNSNRLFGVYDELTTFLTKLNVRIPGKGVHMSFLYFYNCTMGILGREAQVYKRISFECVCMCLKEQRMLVDWSTWLLGLKRLFEVNICFGNIRISTL